MKKTENVKKRLKELNRSLWASMSSNQEITAKRITAIVGAGAVLDFDFSYKGSVYPSTANITKIVKDLKVEGLAVEHSDVIEAVYSCANKKLNTIYRKRGINNHNYEINFEELYFLLESLLMQNVDFLCPEAYPEINTIRETIPELKAYPNVEIERGLLAIIKKIIEIIDSYDSHFRNSMDNDNWYRNFWRNDILQQWDVFTLNYDTTIENSICVYEDGYIQMADNESFESFVPRKLYENVRELSTIQHLHGCIYYAESAPISRQYTHGNRDMFKYHSLEESKHFFGLQQNAVNQANEGFVNSPILIGMRKVEKMIYLPFSIYYINLFSKLQINSGLLIVGYSFGDLYVNQLLQRRTLMHDNRHRLVIIDKFPDYVDSKIQFYRYLHDERPKLLSFLRPFIDFSFDEKLNLLGIEFTSKNEPIYSIDHRCMIYIRGFKDAVEKHEKLIKSFLKG